MAGETNPFYTGSGSKSSSGSKASGGTSSNPFYTGSSSGGTAAPANPNRQLATQLAQLQATLGKFDPSKARALGDLINRYGPDIPPAEYQRAGLHVSAPHAQSLYGQIKSGAGGVLGDIGSVLGRAQQTIYSGIHPAVKGESRLHAIAQGASGHEVQTLADVLDKTAPTSGPLLGLRRTIFKVANFTGSAATDPLTYLTLGSSTAAKEGITQAARIGGEKLGEAGGRELATQVAKKGLRSLAPADRTLVEDAIRGSAADASKAQRVIDAVEKGSSKVRLAGKDLGIAHGLPRRAEEILGQSGVAARAASEASRQTAEQGAKAVVASTAEHANEAKAAVAAAKAANPTAGKVLSGAAATAKAAAANPDLLEEKAANLLTQSKAAATPALQNRLEQQAAETLTRAKLAAKALKAAGGVAATTATPSVPAKLSDILKAAKTDLKAAKAQAKQVGNAADVARQEEAKAAYAAAGKQAGSLKEALVRRSALANTGERRVFAETASNVQGLTRQILARHAEKLQTAIKTIDKPAEDAIVQEVKDGIAKTAAAKAAVAGSPLSTKLGRAAVKQTFDAIKTAHPEWAHVIDAIPIVKGEVKLEAIGKAKNLSDLFEHIVASPIRSGSERTLRETLQARGLSSLRPDVAKAVEGWKAVHISPLDPSVNPSFYRKALGGFRKAATRTPAFFVKNAQTDYASVLTEALADPGGAKALKASVGPAWKASGLLNKPISEWEHLGDPKTVKWLKLAAEHDVTGSDVFHDVSKGTVAATKAKFNPLRIFDPVARIGARASEHGRLTLFFSQLEQGISPERAAATVRNVLGDYSDYTAFEQAFIRNHAVPFYQFYRFNTPFQLAKLVTNPKIAAAQFSAERAFGTSEPGVSALPGSVPKTIALALGGGKVLNTNTGLQAATDVLNPVTQVAAGALSHIPGADRIAPLRQLQAEPGEGGGAKGLLQFVSGPTSIGVAKELTQWVAGKDFFSGAPITERGALRHAFTQMLPELARAERLSGSPGGDWLKVTLSLILGIQQLDLTDAKQRSEVYRRLDIVNKIIHDAQTDGKSASAINNVATDLGITRTQSAKLPTVSELRKSGDLPTPPTTKSTSKSSTSQAVNPFYRG